MKKQYVSPVLNIAAMLLLIVSRLVSEKGFDWLASIALIVMLLSIWSIIKLYRTSK